MMLRYIAKETYYGHVAHAGGTPEITHVSYDGDQEALERFLRYEDQPDEKQPGYFVRELMGVELL